MHSGGALPLGILRCSSRPGDLQSQDAAYLSSMRAWRTTIWGLDANTSYTFSCSLANSRFASGTLRSASSPATVSVQPEVRAPLPPEIQRVLWRSDDEAPEVQIRLQDSYFMDLRCSAFEAADAEESVVMEASETMRVSGSSAFFFVWGGGGGGGGGRGGTCS